MIPAKEEGSVVAEMKLEADCVVHVMGKPAADASGSSADASIPAGSAPAGPAGATVNLGSASGAFAAAPPTSSTVTAALARLAMGGGETYRTALATADKVLGNIISNVSFHFLLVSFP